MVLAAVVSMASPPGAVFPLEQGDPRFCDVLSLIFGTSHDVDVGASCRAYHVDSRQVEVEGLGAVLDEAGGGMRDFR